MKIRMFSKLLAALALIIPSVTFAYYPFNYFYSDLECGLKFSYFLGVNEVSSFTLSPDILPQVQIDFDRGYYGGFTAGYRYRNFRFEEELSLRYNVVNDYDKLPGTCDTLRVTGEVLAVSLMSNLYLDFLLGHRLIPFIGIGGGGAFLNNTVTEPNPGADFSKNVWGFAWQVMAGVGVVLDYHSELDIIYKFYQANLFDYTNGVSNCDTIPAGPGTVVNFSPLYKANTLAVEWRIPPY